MSWRETVPKGTDGLVKVLGAGSPAEAELIAQQLHATWEQMAQLADRWTQAHRQPNFPGRRLTILVGQSRMHFPQALTYRSPHFGSAGVSGRSSSEALVWLLDQQPATVLMSTSGRAGGPYTGHRLDQQPATVLMTTTATGREPQQILRDLKRQLVLVFLSHLPNGQQMPLWVQIGLAEYVAEPPSQMPWPAQMPPVEPLLKEAAWGQNAPEHRQIQPEAYVWAGQWVRYFLEGRDAQYAPVFVEALRSANPQSQLENLLQQVRMASGPAGQWEPEFGQPVVRAVAQSMELGETERKLVFVLKLSWRFAERHPARLSQPKILEQGQDRSLQMAWSPEKPAPNVLKYLEQQIWDPRRPRWATLDWHGQLLFSDDLGRWQAFFQELQAKYRLLHHHQDGKIVLQLQHPEGGLLEGWLEANPADPGRPIAYLRRSKA
ncbi:MAG: hypothetical protein RMI90_14770 [Thermoguttaceae bacterium]|nr:hypothetical protein [Thermoguttaceae bacterium]